MKCFFLTLQLCFNAPAVLFFVAAQHNHRHHYVEIITV